MIDFEKELNEEQLNVVQNGDGPCLVLAGAGSGKTRTITYRVAYLLEKGIAPEEILLVTFTNKAAREMIHRVQALTGIDKRLPWSGTFHHIAYKMLKKYAPLLGYENNFSILDRADSVDLIKLCLKTEGINRKEKRFPSAKVILSIIGYARSAEMMIADVLEEQHPNWIDYSEAISRIGSEYVKKKQEANVMDFDDMLVNLYLLLLKEEHVRKKFSEQFKYVMVDEYQDTNKIQASIINLFSSHHKNLLVVGDDAQSIYSFRAANIKNILEFEHNYTNARVFRLETNYRSTPDILDVANDIISNNTQQYEKELKSVQKLFTKPEMHAFADQQEEAAFIAQRILELRDEGVDLTHVAVLFRAAFHSQALEVELVKRDIPYEYRGGVRFFERSHIKDTLAFLRIINNPADTVAWSRALNMQVGIGPASAQKAIVKIKQNIAADAELFFGVPELLSARARVGWHDFVQIWNMLIESGSDNPSELIRALTESKYADYLEVEYPNYRERIQDIEQFAIFAEGHKELSSFLAEVTMQESFTTAQAKGWHDDDEKIVLSTIHQAKGLEWDAVFVLNLSNGQFPNERAGKNRKGLEEERRLFYVAVTRAKRFLYLTYPLLGSFRSILTGPSRFLEELDRNLLDINNGLTPTGGSTVFLDPSDDVDGITYEAVDDGWGSPSTNFLKSIDEL